MVHRDLQARILARHLVDEMHQRLRYQDVDGHAGFFGLAPHPVHVPFRQQRHQYRYVKGKAQAQHAGLLAPRRQLAARFRVLRVEPPHYRKPVGMRSRGGDAEIVAVAFPRRRHDHHAIDARFVHFAQQIVGAERDRALRFRALGPRTRGRVGAPDVHLRIDDQHASSPKCFFKMRFWKAECSAVARNAKSIAQFRRGSTEI